MSSEHSASLYGASVWSIVGLLSRDLEQAMLLIGNSYWAVLPQSNTTDSMQMTVEVPASSSADIEILIGTLRSCSMLVEREKQVRWGRRTVL